MTSENCPPADAQDRDRADDDQERQEAYRREYQLQLARQSCSGCGETPVY